MIITHKIQCFPNLKQRIIINQTLGACRWIYNGFIAYNIECYKNDKKYTSAYEFSKLLTQLKKYNEDYLWLNDISQKAVKESLIDADTRYRKFLKGKNKFPKFKSKHRNPVTSYYLYPVTGKCKHNKIKLPLLGWMRICENDYVFYTHIINARMIKRDDKYFIQLCTEIEPEKREVLSGSIGIDVGIKKYLSISTENGYYQIDSFLKDKYLVKLNNKIENLQRIISKKSEINYWRLINEYLDKNKCNEPNDTIKNNLRKESYRTYNIYKVKRKIRKIYKKILDYKTDIINKLVINLVKTKPEYIAIEDLSVKNMISKSNPNHIKKLSKYIQDSKFYYFKSHLINKCHEYSIEIHLADKYFASSKICCKCGNKNKDLKLSDRIYKCECCGLEIDRDINAVINLRNMKKNYSIV